MNFIKIFEKYKPRLHGTSNIFSEGHRKYLPGWCYMVDIDNVYLDDNNKIVIILEDKYKFNSKLSNPLLKDNWQRKALLKLCNKINCYLTLNEINSDKWYYVDSNDTITENYNIKDKLSKYTLEKTENSLFLEMRKGEILSVMYIKGKVSSEIINYINNFNIKTVEVFIDNDTLTIGGYKIKNPNDWKIVYDIIQNNYELLKNISKYNI